MFGKKKGGQLPSVYEEENWVAGGDKRKKHPVLVAFVIFIVTFLFIIVIAAVAKLQRPSVDLGTPDGLPNSYGNRDSSGLLNSDFSAESQNQGSVLESDVDDSNNSDDNVQESVLGNDSSLSEGGSLDANNAQDLNVSDPTKGAPYYFTLCRQLEKHLESVNNLATYEDIEEHYNGISYLLTTMLLEYSVDESGAVLSDFPGFNFTSYMQGADLSYVPSATSNLYITSENFGLVLQDLGDGVDTEVVTQYTVDLINYAIMVQYLFSAYITSDFNQTDLQTYDLPYDFYLSEYKDSRNIFVEQLTSTPYRSKLAFSIEFK